MIEYANDAGHSTWFLASESRTGDGATEAEAVPTYLCDFDFGFARLRLALQRLLGTRLLWLGVPHHAATLARRAIRVLALRLRLYTERRRARDRVTRKELNEIELRERGVRTQMYHTVPSRADVRLEGKSKGPPAERRNRIVRRGTW